MLIAKPPAEIADRWWMLGLPQYPVYLLQGEHANLLVEGGIGPLAPLLHGQLGELGVAPDSVEQLVVTHAHPDHVMAVPQLRTMLPRAAVVASAAAAATLAVDKAVAFFCKMDDGLTESLIAQGVLEEQDRRPPLTEPTIAVDRVVGDGDSLQLEDTTIQVLATPGHSDCSISLFDAQRGVLIISDATGYYLPEQDYWWPNYFTGYEAYLASIRRLAEVPAEVLGLSHNGVLVGRQAVADYFRKALAATEAYHQRIVAEVRGGKSVRDVAGPLGEEVHQHTPLMPVSFFQKNCALLIKQSLAHEGIEAGN